MAKNPWQLPSGYDAATRKALAQMFAALKNARTHISPAAYEALRLGNVQAFINLVDWDSIGNDLGDIGPILEDFAAKTGVEIYKEGGIVGDLLFDIIDKRAVIWAQNHTADLVVEIAEEMRQQIRNVMAESTQGLLTAEQAARKIRTNLPLTSRDSAAVDSYYSRQINKLVKSGMTIDKATEKASARADRYAAKLLRKRSQTIARTELANAASNGRRLGWESGVSEGYIDPASTKEWVAEPDACDICGPMDGVSVPMNDEFPSGAMMPPQHPNCRCAAILLPPEYADDYFTPTAKDGGNVDVTVSFTKHQAGKHDQSSHGKGSATGKIPKYTERDVKLKATTRVIDGLDVGKLDDARVGKFGMAGGPQQGAIASYTSGDYKIINQGLRKDSLSPQARQIVNQVDKAIDSNAVVEDLDVFRVAEKGRLPKGLKVGDTFTDKAYLSTSKHNPNSTDARARDAYGEILGWTKDPVTMTVRVPKGTKALDLGAYSKYSQEAEVLFPRETKLKVLSMDGNQLEVEVVS